MCSGTIFPKLVTFIVPLMLSSILQLLFNAADIIVVGRFSGSEALAAVGSTTALVNIVVTVFIGISMGTNVMTARYMAQHDEEKICETVHTSVTFAVLSGLFMILVGITAARPALLLLGSPPEILPLSALYIRIYSLGMPFFMLYNYGAAILRAVGDTRRPMLYLMAAGVINVCLNVFLVAAAGLGVAGVAIATAVSQMISGILVLWCLIRTEGAYRVRRDRLGISLPQLGRIMQIGLPAGVQSGIISISNALLQSSVNSFGATAMAGYTAANNLFGFLWVTVNSISQGCMSFTSQNYGAGETKRMDRILLDCLILNCTLPLVLSNLVYLLGRRIVPIYTDSPEVISSAMAVLSTSMPWYFFCGIMDLIPGALRGLGHSTVPMLLSIIGTVGVRIVWIYGFFPAHHTLSFLFICYPLSWIITILLQGAFYVKIRKRVYR